MKIYARNSDRLMFYETVKSPRRGGGNCPIDKESPFWGGRLKKIRMTEKTSKSLMYSASEKILCQGSILLTLQR